MTDIADIDTALRLLLAAALGAAVGLERESRGQLAGLRTHALVAVGTALFTLVGAYGFHDIPRGLNVDPMRVAAQVVSGIGFIGAGAILRDAGSVRGITTAAALWTSAALGMAAGAGLYAVAATGCAVILATLIGLRAVRERGMLNLGRHSETVNVAYRRGHGTIASIIEAVDESGAALERLKIQDDDMRREVSLTVRTRDRKQLRACLDKLTDRPEVHELVVSS